MKPSRFTVFGSLLLVFASGAVLGALGYRYYNLKTVAAVSPAGNRSPEEFRKRYMVTMRDRLKLTPKQEESLSGILDETREKYRVFWEKHGDERKEIEDNQVVRINAILDEAQQAEYAAMRKEREDRRKAMMEGETKNRDPKVPAPASR